MLRQAFSRTAPHDPSAERAAPRSTRLAGRQHATDVSKVERAAPREVPRFQAHTDPSGASAPPGWWHVRLHRSIRTRITPAASSSTPHLSSWLGPHPPPLIALQEAEFLPPSPHRMPGRSHNSGQAPENETEQGRVPPETPVPASVQMPVFGCKSRSKSTPISVSVGTLGRPIRVKILIRPAGTPDHTSPHAGSVGVRNLTGLSAGFDMPSNSGGIQSVASC